VSSPAAPAEQQTPVGDTGGLGVSPATEIVALPPQPVNLSGLDIDPKTGEPRRTALIKAIIATFAAAGAAVFVGYWLHWWWAINIVNFAHSANLINWVNPRPGSGMSIFLVIVLAVIGAAGVAGPWIASYNLHGGARWSRWAGVAAIITSVLATVLLHYWLAVAVVLCVVATGLLWTRPAEEYFRQWDEYLEPPVAPITPPEHVEYGPTARFS